MLQRAVINLKKLDHVLGPIESYVLALTAIWQVAAIEYYNKVSHIRLIEKRKCHCIQYRAVVRVPSIGHIWRHPSRARIEKEKKGQLHKTTFLSFQHFTNLRYSKSSIITVRENYFYIRLFIKLFSAGLINKQLCGLWIHNVEGTQALKWTFPRVIQQRAKNIEK